MRFERILILAAIVIGLFSVLWLLVYNLLAERIPHASTFIPQARTDYIFDYVIVGAGTAGTVMASLLAKHSNGTVLLIEAGDKFGFLSKIPLLTTLQQKGLNDWGFLSVPQKHSSKGLEQQRQCLPRGKGLGGSAQLNYMLHFDGNEEDFHTWSTAYNLSSWRWQAVKPFLEAGKAKSYEMYEIPPHYSKLTESMQRAEVEFGHKPWRFRNSRYNIKKGLRFSVFQRFLQPVWKNRNLRILTNAMAKRIQLVDGRAQSLLVGIKNEENRKEQLLTIEIRGELIISTGAYQTPQLLLVSGIGDTKALEKKQISTQLHLPRVGQGLYDHLNLPLFVSIEVVGPSLNQRALFDPFSLWNYVISGTGHLGNFGVLSHIDAMTTEQSFGLTFFAAGGIDETAFMSLSNFKLHHFRALFPRYYNSSQEGFVLISNCFQPKSRGSVSISGPNIRKNPLIDPNYLSDQSDVNCTIQAIRTAVEVVTSESFTSLRPQIHWPKIRQCSNFGPFERDFKLNTPTDRYLECVIRHVGLTGHHPGGSCAMGASLDNSVVDEQFRLHGVENVRIVDASVLPAPISGHPNSIIVGLSIRAATMLLKKELDSEAKSS